jgi:hypothetical protein
MNHPECVSCRYRAMRDPSEGEWCYMFFDEPAYYCAIPDREERRLNRVREAVANEETFDIAGETYVEFLIRKGYC